MMHPLAQKSALINVKFKSEATIPLTLKLLECTKNPGRSTLDWKLLILASLSEGSWCQRVVLHAPTGARQASTPSSASVPWNVRYTLGSASASPHGWRCSAFCSRIPSTTPTHTASPCTSSTLPTWWVYVGLDHLTLAWIPLSFLFH